MQMAAVVNNAVPAVSLHLTMVAKQRTTNVTKNIKYMSDLCLRHPLDKGFYDDIRVLWISLVR